MLDEKVWSTLDISTYLSPFQQGCHQGSAQVTLGPLHLKK